MADLMHALLTSRPINKGAAVVTNQHACADEIELNRMIDERRILRENVKIWSAESIASAKRRKELKHQLIQAGDRLAQINQVMQNNPDMKSAARFKSLNDAIVSVARDVIPSNVFQQIVRRARAAMRVKR